jgi:hypothetical protein
MAKWAAYVWVAAGCGGVALAGLAVLGLIGDLLHGRPVDGCRTYAQVAMGSALMGVGAQYQGPPDRAEPWWHGLGRAAGALVGVVLVGGISWGVNYLGCEVAWALVRALLRLP